MSSAASRASFALDGESSVKSAAKVRPLSPPAAAALRLAGVAAVGVLKLPPPQPPAAPAFATVAAYSTQKDLRQQAPHELLKASSRVGMLTNHQENKS